MITDLTCSNKNCPMYKNGFDPENKDCHNCIYKVSKDKVPINNNDFYTTFSREINPIVKNELPTKETSDNIIAKKETAIIETTNNISANNISTNNISKNKVITDNEIINSEFVHKETNIDEIITKEAISEEFNNKKLPVNNDFNDTSSINKKTPTENVTQFTQPIQSNSIDFGSSRQDNFDQFNVPTQDISNVTIDYQEEAKELKKVNRLYTPNNPHRDFYIINEKKTFDKSNFILILILSLFSILIIAIFLKILL